MNKKVLFFISILSAFCIMLVIAVISLFGIRSSTLTLQKALQSKDSAFFEITVASFQNQLLLGNIRGVRNEIATLQSKDVFCGYTIVQDRTNIDSSWNCGDNEKARISIATIPVYYNDGGKKWGDVVFYTKQIEIEKLTSKLARYLVLILISVGIFFIGFYLISYFFLWKSARVLVPLFESLISNEKIEAVGSLTRNIWTPLLKKHQSLEKQVQIWRDEILQKEKQRTMNEIAQQVSHDIRSPLSALNMMLMDLKELPEQKRVIVRSALQRINDISNSLLEKSKGQTVSSPTQSSTSPVAITSAGATEVVLLSSVVGELLSEKRIQFRDKADVSIEEDLTKAYGYFTTVNATELKRVLSNLINNSIEAFPDGKGRVTVGIRGYKDVVQIIISDNGKGIPASVLAKLGERGVSHGKESSGTSGSGLGVYHAKSTVEKYGGKFEIQSREGQGTMIQIQLPRAVAPEWFVEELRFKPGMTVFSLDDDQSIHGIWQGRLEAENANHHKIEFHRYTSVRSFMDSYLELNPEVRSQALFLIDYEFLNQSLNGLEIIQKLGIAKQSILVTSHASRLEIQNQCVALGVKLLPKELSSAIPMKVERA